VLALVLSIPSQETGFRKQLQNDLFCVERGVKPQLSQWVVVMICVCVTAEDLATFPVDVDTLSQLKQCVDLTRSIDTAQHRWLTSSAPCLSVCLSVCHKWTWTDSSITRSDPSYRRCSPSCHIWDLALTWHTALTQLNTGDWPLVHLVCLSVCLSQMRPCTDLAYSFDTAQHRWLTSSAPCLSVCLSQLRPCTDLARSRQLNTGYSVVDIINYN